MLIKVKFIKNGTPKGREYIYRAPDDLEVGDTVELPSGKGVVAAIDVPESEVVGYVNVVKEIVKVISDKESEE